MIDVLKIHWFLPTGGDARDVLPDRARTRNPRAPDLPYLAQVATACDRLGYDGMLTPCGTGCEDAWLATASLIPLTRRIKFLVAFRPALLTPTLAAQMASTYQRLSGRPAARQHRHRRGAGGARPVRRPRGQGDPVRADRRVPRDRPRRLERRAVHVPGPALRGHRRDHPRAARPRAGDLLRRRLARGRAGRGRARRRVPRLG